MKKNRWFFFCLASLMTVCLFISCNTGDDQLPLQSYTYTSGTYVMTITPDLGYGRAVLAEGETGTYTLKFDGVVSSSGRVLMGVTEATFEPYSGKPTFHGTIGDSELVITDQITGDDGNPIPLSTMSKVTDDEAAFAEYWGVWRATVGSTPVILTIEDGTWDIWIGSDHYWGTYTQTGATTADIIEDDGWYGKIGHVVTGANVTMTITLNNDTQYPGTYELTR
jgi:hypothetical protein